MRRKQGAFLICMLLGVTGSKILSAEPNWAGEYADKHFLDGQAVFEMSIDQSGNAIKVSFSAAYNDAHGAAPDGEGQGKITGKNTAEFKWEDSFENSGIGTIKRTGGSIAVSMNAVRVADSRCLAFYGENMRLRRVKK